MPCNKRDFIIRNASVVTPGGILKGASLRIEDGIIVVLREGEIKSFLSIIDAEGMYVLPGFVDLHSDAIEKGIEPRPNVFFPVNIAVYELDKK
ncbi:MAG TPA: alpha-D-ribose 1-methylphosphonate 5-triphosphate diphosphatase, partial [Nitrospirae bacterium]|nr:alpha-D-ribose 1-methylphosphonate 5-triphosphate diphosphatase [Nitrospirota bacterium]